MDAKIEEAIRAFKFEYPEYASVTGAEQQCHTASSDFVACLRDFGIKSTVVEDPTNDGHYIVKTDGFFIDWTARQFDRYANWPKITEVDDDRAVGEAAD